MDSPYRILKDFQAAHAFFIGVDSDGCVFDTMEIKQKECFYPTIVKFWNLQPIAEYVRETVEYVNLYSIYRGTNRFMALVKLMEELEKRPEVRAADVVLPDLTALRQWTEQETMLGNPALERYAQKTNEPILAATLRWSLAINATIADRVSKIPPFPFVRESLRKMSERADTMVVSQTPLEALEREWQDTDLAQYARIIAGQEYGTKAEHLAYAAKGKYPEHNILMIGDALGDLNAAKSNGALFYPINPGQEESSWKRFYHEALDRFFAGAYAGEYEKTIIEEFHAYLPDTPPWKM